MRIDFVRRGAALLALILLTALGVGSTSSYFSDAVTFGGRYVTDIPESPTPTPSPAVPPECAGMTFTQVIVGTAGDDHIRAGNGGALVFGLGGNDTIEGGNGKDCLAGGPGEDTLIGGNGKDVLLSGEGSDHLDGGNGKDTCYGTWRDHFKNCECVWKDGSRAPDIESIAAPELSPTTDPESTPEPDSGTIETPPSWDATPSPAAIPEPRHPRRPGARCGRNAAHPDADANAGGNPYTGADAHA